MSKIELEQFVKVQGQTRKDYSTDVAINNDTQATTNKSLQDTTLDVLDTQMDNASYNIGIVKQDDVNNFLI